MPPQSQPLAHAHQHAVPTFLGAAVSDSLVNPARNTQALASALAAGGTAVTLKMYERTGH